VPTVRNLHSALNPAVKSLNYLNNILAKIEANNAGVEEAVMLNAPIREEPNRLPACFRETLRNALAILLEAHSASLEFGWDQFRASVSLRELQLHGGTLNQLHWLAECGHVRLIANPTRGATALSISFPLEDSLNDTSRIVLLPEGVALAKWYFRNEKVGPPLSAPSVELKPRWDAALRTLWHGSHVVKRFRVPAVNQEIVLQVFEEEGWPRMIDDPIPQDHSRDRKVRLHDTIRRLNNQQHMQRLRFAGNGRGDGVCWEVDRT